MKDQMVDRKISNGGAVAEDHFQAKGKQVRTLYTPQKGKKGNQRGGGWIGHRKNLYHHFTEGPDCSLQDI